MQSLKHVYLNLFSIFSNRCFWLEIPSSFAISPWRHNLHRMTVGNWSSFNTRQITLEFAECLCRWPKSTKSTPHRQCQRQHAFHAASTKCRLSNGTRQAHCWLWNFHIIFAAAAPLASCLAVTHMNIFMYVCNLFARVAALRRLWVRYCFQVVLMQLLWLPTVANR